MQAGSHAHTSRGAHTGPWFRRPPAPALWPQLGTSGRCVLLPRVLHASSAMVILMCWPQCRAVCCFWCLPLLPEQHWSSDQCAGSGSAGACQPAFFFFESRICQPAAGLAHQRLSQKKKKKKKKKDCVPVLARAPWALAPLPAVSVRRGTTRRTTSRDRHYHSTAATHPITYWR